MYSKSAIADRGWNPLNYNCLLHPEIVATRHEGEVLSCSGEDDDDDDTREDVVVPAAGISHVVDLLNLSKGLSGTLINSIIETRAGDDARNGINLEENRRKRVETLKQLIAAKKKRYTAGLHVSAQRFITGPVVRDDMEEREQQQADVLSKRQEKKLREFRSMKCKVDALKLHNF